jgi:hypothetical protein
MILMPLGCGIIGGAKLASVEFVSYGMSSSNSSSYNFGSKAIGDADPSRILIVRFSWQPQISANFSHFSIDGNAMTLQVSNNVITPANGFNQIRTLPWPTGTTATVTMAASAQMLSCYWMMWAAYDLKNEAPYASSQPALANPQNSSINVPAGGIIVGGTMMQSSLSSGVSWTGITEDLDVTGGISSAARMSGASGAFKHAQTPLAVSSDAGTNHQHMLASFR